MKPFRPRAGSPALRGAPRVPAGVLAILAMMTGAVSCSNEPATVFRDRSEARLPTDALGGFSMDAAPADIDNDGDTDILIAHEYEPNILLINDGTGTFTDESAARLPQVDRDSEDIAVADFDRDGDLDVVVVSEDDRVNEYYRNAGGPRGGDAESREDGGVAREGLEGGRSGIGLFEDAGDRIPVRGRSNAVVSAELTGDGYPDLIIGNNGVNRFLTNDRRGGFVDETAERLPGVSTGDGDRTQDLELGDVDGDGDPDLVVGNEDRNRLLINDGTGSFRDESDERLVFRGAPEETREADFGDIDGDGDLDLFFANVRAFVPKADPRNRVLLNDGGGRFTDVTEAYLPQGARPSFDADFVDIDGDGDLDVISADTAEGWRSPARARLLINTALEGDESPAERRFEDGTERFFPETARGNGFDVEAADFDSDGELEIYLANRAGSPDRFLDREDRLPDRPTHPEDRN